MVAFPDASEYPWASINIRVMSYCSQDVANVYFAMWSSHAYLASISPYIVQTYAFTSFDTNCTLPHVSYNYLSAPNVRSTLDITWSSLATIIACTFTVLHLNVPEQRDGRDAGRKGDVKWWWIGIRPTLQWTAITLVAPEYYALNAINAFLVARQTKNFLQGTPRARHPLCGWTMVHAFYINMGGYAIHLPEKSASKIPQNTADDRMILTHLGARSFCKMSLRDMHDSDRLLSDTDITDRSKSDALAKCLAILQVLYFCTNCIVRAVKSLPISPMEIGTLGFAFCSFVSYGFLFNKPRSVKTAVIVEASVFDLDRHVREALEEERAERYGECQRATIPNDAVDIKLARKILPPLTLAFGAIHFAAWNFSFPTAIEQWLWRVCVVYSTASLPAGYYLGLIPGLTRWVDEFSLVSTSIGMYSVSRLIIIVVMVRCLFYLPPESFMNTWAANLPHV